MACSRRSSPRVRRIWCWQPCSIEKALTRTAAAATAEDRDRVLSMFRFMGRFVAQALQDDRPLDLPFSEAMCKVLLGRPLTTRCEALRLLVGSFARLRRVVRLPHSDVAGVDVSFAKSLAFLESIAADAADIRQGLCGIHWPCRWMLERFTLHATTDASLAADERARRLAELTSQVDAMYLTFGIANNTPDGEPLIALVRWLFCTAALVPACG